MLIFLILCVLLLLSFGLEHFLVKLPIHLPTQRKLSASLIHVFSVVIVFSALFLIFQRPIFSASLTLVLHSVLIVINHAKYQALKEPMVFSDIVMFSQAFKFPRLYFPFIPIVILVLAPVAVLTLFYAGVYLETAIVFESAWILTLGVMFLNIDLIFIIYHLAGKQTLSLKTAKDLQELGLLSSLIIGTVQALKKQQKQAFHTVLTQQSPFLAIKKTSDKKSDVIVIQNESFFDVRRLYKDIAPSILKNYDEIKNSSIFSGKLNVPAWGANTMRSEFAFLSAMEQQQLGLYRYYPYHYLTQSVPSVVSHYKQQGYKTVCIHPHPAAFFERQRVFKLLGFDEFIDINEFDNKEGFGPYISDEAVAKKIIERQKQSVEPLFIFAITMENHGPLHLEQITDAEIQSLYQTPPKFEHRNLSIYLRHLKNADSMIKKITTQLQQTKPCYLCFYGDHVPSIPDAYQALDFQNSQSDYFIWHNHKQNKAAQTKDIFIHQLSLQLSSIDALSL